MILLFEILGAMASCQDDILPDDGSSALVMILSSVIIVSNRRYKHTALSIRSTKSCLRVLRISATTISTNSY